jgi:hypothetical protein
MKSSEIVTENKEKSGKPSKIHQSVLLNFKKLDHVMKEVKKCDRR